MAVWVVRAGRYGEQETLALEKGWAVIGWSELPDLTTFTTREALRERLAQEHPDASKNSLGMKVGQVWKFREEIHLQDLIVLPLKNRSAIAVGRVTGPYQYQGENPPGAQHVRPVKWLRTDLPRSAFDQDLLYSLGSLLTVSQPRKKDAEARILALLSGSPPPPVVSDEEEAKLDIQGYASDQIRAYLGHKFRGHELTRLVTEILRAQGYQAQMSPAGPDGGVDILSGRGPMGFDAPHLCVQVKSSDSPVDVNVLRSLQGVMKNFGAQQGLLVAWRGFTQAAVNEARRLFFELRLWDAGDVVAALLNHYEHLNEEIRAELPLKRIWVLVPEEE